MASNPNRYDYDSEQYYYDEDCDYVRSYDGEEVYEGDGTPVSYDD